ncbi:hypothetical protein K7X08_018018 [Anisodus acutangulus]|uniref:Cytochrome P450 n=1 Tax=Anisodus acutangulus TaxID=402998 RepID=A0A9Q1LXL9_9SOLA|nr:hypothetical protein K7X08_018018 [Anisodus acutangulus]
MTGEVISRTAFGSSYEEGRIVFELQKEQAEHVMGAAFGFIYQGRGDYDLIRDVKEIPPLPTLGRRTKEEVKLGELNLPAEVLLVIPAVLVHCDKEIRREDAKEFEPKRFSEGVSKATNGQVSFIPFGEGPRICIGQNFAMLEAKMAIAMILQKFSFELSSSYTHAPFQVVTIHPQYGAPLLMRKH